MSSLDAQNCEDSYPIQWDNAAVNNPEGVQWTAWALYVPPVILNERRFVTKEDWILTITDNDPFWNTCALSTTVSPINVCLAKGIYTTSLCKYSDIAGTQLTFISQDVLNVTFYFTAGMNNECCFAATNGETGGQIINSNN